MFNLKNLDDVERYIKENMPDWTMKRGKLSSIQAATEQVATDNELIILYSPDGEPIAQFWKGYYRFSPDAYTGIYKLVVHGDLNYIMRCVIED